MQTTEIEYVLAAGQRTMELYKISVEALMESKSYDFMVYQFEKWDDVIEDLQEWEDYITIDKASYHLLYTNLCVKFRRLIEYL